MSNLERVAVGIRHPNRESIEYTFLQAGGADNLLPMLRRQHVKQPKRMFNELAAERRLFQAGDGVDFHKAVRQAGASRWYIHQIDRWDGGPVKPLHHRSLLTRWYYAAASFGGNRFHPGDRRLGRVSGDLRRHCIMGMLVELFLDDYPGALVTVEKPPRETSIQFGDKEGRIEYKTFQPGDECRSAVVLPAIVRREVGLTDHRGSFELNDQVVQILEEGYRVPLRQLQEAGVQWNLVSLNDTAMNWPLAASLIALPAPGLFVDVRTR